MNSIKKIFSALLIIFATLTLSSCSGEKGVDIDLYDDLLNYDINYTLDFE